MKMTVKKEAFVGGKKMGLRGVWMCYVSVLLLSASLACGVETTTKAFGEEGRGKELTDLTQVLGELCMGSGTQARSTSMWEATMGEAQQGVCETNHELGGGWMGLTTRALEEWCAILMVWAVNCYYTIQRIRLAHDVETNPGPHFDPSDQKEGSRQEETGEDREERGGETAAVETTEALTTTATSSSGKRNSMAMGSYEGAMEQAGATSEETENKTKEQSNGKRQGEAGSKQTNTDNTSTQE